MLSCRAGKGQNTVFFRASLLLVAVAGGEGEGRGGRCLACHAAAAGALDAACGRCQRQHQLRAHHPERRRGELACHHEVNQTAHLHLEAPEFNAAAACHIRHAGTELALACGFVSTCKAHPTLLQDFYELLVGYIADSDEVNDTNFSNAGHDPAGASSALTPSGDAQMEGIPKMVSQARLCRQARRTARLAADQRDPHLLCCSSGHICSRMLCPVRTLHHLCRCISLI